MNRKNVINHFKILGVSASTLDHTRKLKNCEEESCLLRKAGSSGKNETNKMRQLVQLGKEISHQTEKSQAKLAGKTQSFGGHHKSVNQLFQRFRLCTSCIVFITISCTKLPESIFEDD